MKTKITVVSMSVKSGTAEKSGKDWALFSIYDGENWFTFFGAEWNADLQNLEEGDEIEVYYIVEKYKGKSKNVIVPPSDPRVATEKIMEEKFEKINNRCEILEARLDEIDEAAE